MSEKHVLITLPQCQNNGITLKAILVIKLEELSKLKRGFTSNCHFTFFIHAHTHLCECTHIHTHMHVYHQNKNTLKFKRKIFKYYMFKDKQVMEIEKKKGMLECIVL